MSTRANIIIKDSHDKLYFYRHSDGYPECCGEDLKDFVKGYANGTFRCNVIQSAGHLIIRGRDEYLKDGLIDGPIYGWKVGAYEPTTDVHGDIDYLYEIDLPSRSITCNGKPYYSWD